MRTLIKKELRENLKLALPGLLLAAVFLVRAYQNCATQPLLTVAVLRPIELFCSILGLGLGWLQIHHERHRDLWAFLIHRPLTRTEIFLAKVAAGLGLYCLAAGLPLVGLIAASAVPGHFASPFEWAMILPVGGAFLRGMVWYFAGLLAGLRQARWYASRGLGLTAAMLISILAATEPAWLPGFRQQFLVLAIGGTILAMAAWGAFAGDGSDRGQPAWGRRALAATLVFGVVLIGIIGQGLLEGLLLRGRRSESAHHEITRDGVICEIIQKAGQSAEVLDFVGRPLEDPETGRRMSLAKFDRFVAESFPIDVDFGDQSRLRNLLQPSTRFFALLQTADRVSWYWSRDGKLLGYDTVTRRLVGRVAPDGFPGPASRFLRPQTEPEADPDEDSGPQHNNLSGPTIATPAAVYRLNLENRSTRVLFSTTDEDKIGGALSIDDQGIVVVTRHLIQMVAPDGKSLWKVPYHSNDPGAMWVKVSRLRAPQQFAVWIGSYHPANRQNRIEARRYSRVLFVSAEQGVLKEVQLSHASLTGRQSSQALSYRLAAVLMTPLPVFDKLLGWQTVPWDLVEISLGVAAVCVLAGWWLGRRYSFPIRTQLAWAGFHLVSGLPGFLAFLSMQEWAAREPCPNCKKMRVVEQARCEHCEAGFAPAEKNGTEIFAPLTAGPVLLRVP